MSADPQLTSFVLRFISEAAEPATEGQAASAPRWRGVVRHVQSDAEQHFTRWEEAEAFIAQFVSLWGPSSDGGAM